MTEITTFDQPEGLKLVELTLSESGLGSSNIDVLTASSVSEVRVSYVLLGKCIKRNDVERYLSMFNGDMSSPEVIASQIMLNIVEVLQPKWLKVVVCLGSRVEATALYEAKVTDIRYIPDDRALKGARSDGIA